MISSFNSIRRCIKPLSRFYSNHIYEIPERLREAFFCANASLADSVNWFKHAAIQNIYGELIEEVERKFKLSSNEDAVRIVNQMIEDSDACNQLIELNLNVELQDGSKPLIKFYRAQNSRLANFFPSSGGIRISPTEKKHVLRGLSNFITLRNAWVYIPISGSYGAILVDPSELNKQDLKTIVQKFSSALFNRNCLGLTTDILEPDLNCSLDAMGWMASFPLEEGNVIPSTCVVGKPPSFVNSLKNFDELMGSSAVYILELFLNDEDILKEFQITKGLRGKKFVLQGLGRYGYNIGRKLEKEGALCVGIKEHDCFLYMKEGIKLDDAFLYKINNGTLQNFNEVTKPYDSYEVIKEDCDILVLAAKESNLHCHIAEKVQANIIFEASYAAITPTAYKILVGTKKLLIPDLMVNGGFAMMTFMEYMKNKEFAEKGCITDSFRELIQTYFVTACPLQKLDKVIAKAPNEYLIQDSDDVIQTLNEEDLIQTIIENVLLKNYQDTIAITKNYKLDSDFKIASNIKAAKNYFRDVIDARLI